MTPATDYIRKLVSEDRIHRSVYLDPEIFELEMKRIFGRVWIYVGHESQVPNTGDFYCTTIGLQPVVMSRHGDGNVHVVHNRCAHRGAKVLTERSGHREYFHCMYHGWTYRNDGSLAGCPLRSQEEQDGFDFSRLRMEPVARLQSYHGLVFASLAREGPDLIEYLGEEVRTEIDEFVEAAPDGCLEVNAGCHRYEYRGNWKHQVENMVDAYHTIPTHLSSSDPQGVQFRRRSGDNAVGVTGFDPEEQSFVRDLLVWTYPRAHSKTTTMFSDAQAGGIWEDYRRILTARRGAERAEELLEQKLHNLTIYPQFRSLGGTECDKGGDSDIRGSHRGADLAGTSEGHSRTGVSRADRVCQSNPRQPHHSCRPTTSKPFAAYRTDWPAKEKNGASLPAG